MDLVALTLIASSVLAFLGVILAGFIFAPWVMVFGALGLLALLPRITDGKSATQNGSTLANGSIGNGSAPQAPRSATPLASSEPGFKSAKQTAQRPLRTLQYRGNFYQSAVASKTAALQETSLSDR